MDDSMDSMAGCGPRETHDEQPAAEDNAGTLVHESGQDVVVHGNGGIQEMLQELDDIAAVVERSRNGSSRREPKRSRKFDSPDEFRELKERLRRRQAQVVLRKVFLYHGSCNVEQEIWIKDPRNPDAAHNPLKEYSVVHAHHHARVANVKDVKREHLVFVDAMNARHLAIGGAPYQCDNPFFNTFIEPSGSTLKVFPHEESWKCSVCRQSNYQTKPYCRGWRGSTCSGVRPCSKWNWKQQKSRDEGLALILQLADEALQWASV